MLSQSQRREAPFRALARGEGPNSARLFTPWKSEVPAPSYNIFPGGAAPILVCFSNRSVAKNIADFRLC